MHEHDTLSISPRSLQARVWPWRNRSASEVAAVIEQPRFIHSFARGSGCALDFCSAHSPAAGPLPAQTAAMSGKTKKNRKKGVAHPNELVSSASTSTFEMQALLPRLPVPDVRQTVQQLPPQGVLPQWGSPRLRWCTPGFPTPCFVNLCFIMPKTCTYRDQWIFVSS